MRQFGAQPFQSMGRTLPQLTEFLLTAHTLLRRMFRCKRTTLKISHIMFLIHSIEFAEDIFCYPMLTATRAIRVVGGVLVFDAAGAYLLPFDFLVHAESPLQHIFFKQHFSNFFPLPQGHKSLLPMLFMYILRRAMHNSEALMIIMAKTSSIHFSFRYV